MSDNAAIPKHPSHPDVPRPSDAELVELAIQVCYAIEACGASLELTYAVTQASNLIAYLRKPSNPESGMTFGQAVEALKAGKSVSRDGWNGKGMFLFIIQGSNDIAKLHGYGFGEYLGEPTFRDAIFMRTVDNQLVPWTASQSDVLAEDWAVI